MVLTLPCEMGMVTHETVTEDLHVITIFKAEEEVVIKLFGPVGIQQEILVMALPSDVEDTVIIKDEMSGSSGHG